MKYLLEENFITGLLKHVAGYEWLESMKVSSLSGLRSFVHNEYLREYPVALELKQSFQNSTTKAAAKYFARRIVTTAKRHAKENCSLLLNRMLATKLKSNPVTAKISALKKTIALLHRFITCCDDKVSSNIIYKVCLNHDQPVDAFIRLLYELYRTSCRRLKTKKPHLLMEILRNLRQEVSQFNRGNSNPTLQVKSVNMYPIFHLTSAFVPYDREGIIEMHALASNAYKSDSTCETQRPSRSPRASTRRGLLPKVDSINYFYRVFDIYGVSCTGDDYDVTSDNNAANTLSRGKRLRNYRVEENRRSDLGHSRKAIRRRPVRNKLGIPSLYKFREFFDDSSKYQQGEKLPYLVENVSSNGLELKVTLVTVVHKAENEAGFNN